MGRIACIFLAGWLFVSMHSAVRADMIADWNEKAVNAGNMARVGNFPTARAITMVYLAMFEALNSIEQRYTPYRARVSADPMHPKRLRLAAHMPFWFGCIPNKLRNWTKRLRRHSPPLRMVHPRPKGLRSDNRLAP